MKRNDPRILHRLVLGQTLVRLAGGELFLVTALMLGDLFSTMWKLLALDAPLSGIALWILMGIPAHATQALPVAYLFAVTLTLSTMHADGELIVINGSGISIQRLSLPVILFSLALCAALFVSKDLVEIPLAVSRQDLYGTMTGQGAGSGRLADVALMTDSGRFVYRAVSFDPAAGKLARPDIVIRAEDGSVQRRVTANVGTWDGSLWRFESARIIDRSSEGGWTGRTESGFADPAIDEPPSSFGNLKADPKSMATGELRASIAFLESSGLPSAEAATELNKRYSFMLTPLIVSGLSVAFCGVFRKNSLLMSLLFSLGVATIYYVAQMLGSISAKTGWVKPELGVWSVTILFLAFSAFSFARART